MAKRRFWSDWRAANKVEPDFTGIEIGMCFLSDDEDIDLMKTYCVADQATRKDDHALDDAIQSATDQALRALYTRAGEKIVQETADDCDMDMSDFAQIEINTAVIWVDGKRVAEDSPGGLYNY